MAKDHEIARFWRNVKKTRGCWLWISSRGGTKDRYGMFRLGGTEFRAHRASWIINCGEVPKGLHVLHKCDQAKCVKPAHLFLGTHQDNMRDRTLKGRTHSKLTKKDVLAIRKKYIRWVYTIYQLADEYGVSAKNISSIIRRETWCHV